MKKLFIAWLLILMTLNTLFFATASWYLEKLMK